MAGEKDGLRTCEAEHTVHSSYCKVHLCPTLSPVQSPQDGGWPLSLQKTQLRKVNGKLQLLLLQMALRL